jgi:hypothetical protein
MQKRTRHNWGHSNSRGQFFFAEPLIESKICVMAAAISLVTL